MVVSNWSAQVHNSRLQEFIITAKLLKCCIKWKVLISTTRILNGTTPHLVYTPLNWRLKGVSVALKFFKYGMEYGSPDEQCLFRDIWKHKLWAVEGSKFEPQSQEISFEEVPLMDLYESWYKGSPQQFSFQGKVAAINNIKCCHKEARASFCLEKNIV